jgi:hypothetical protein
MLEDGFQLDEAVASILALAQSIQVTNDDAFLLQQHAALLTLRDRLLERFDSATGLTQLRSSSLKAEVNALEKLPIVRGRNSSYICRRF